MKSGKQRRQEIKLRRLARSDLARATTQRLAEQARQSERDRLRDAGGVWVDRTALAPSGSYDIPDFVQVGYYVDMPFTCKDCGKAEVWTAIQQQWWYEVAKGDVWTRACRCRPCRQKERMRRDAARQVHLEGLARK